MPTRCPAENEPDSRLRAGQEDQTQEDEASEGLRRERTSHRGAESYRTATIVQSRAATCGLALAARTGGREAVRRAGVEPPEQAFWREGEAGVAVERLRSLGGLR